MGIIKRLLLALALLAPSLASAGTINGFVVPPDLTSQPGGGYTAVAPVYDTSGGVNSPTDPTMTPPPQLGLSNIATVTTTGRVTTTDTYTMCLTTADGGTCPQAKFRTLVGSTHVKILCDDPIRNYGQPGASHCHEFFGNLRINAYSTYASNRNYAASDAAGYDVNGTGYWFPAPYKVNPFSDGHNYAVHLRYAIIYYLENFPADGKLATNLPPGLRYVLLYEMDDQWAWLQSILNTANSAIGHTRYTLTNPSGQMGADFIYNCVDAGTTYQAKVFKNADGSDPFAGHCNAGDDFFVSFSGPDCWDGTNLWSPGGYKHVIPRVYDNDHGAPNGGNFVCPKNYYYVPALQGEFHFTQQGFSDYGSWRLSSDDTRATQCGCTIANGTTLHTDWMNGWDNNIMSVWEQNCIGTLNRTPHECDSSQISSAQHLIGGYVGEAGPVFSPQVDQSTTYPTTSAANMLMMPTTHMGPKTMNVH